VFSHAQQSLTNANWKTTSTLTPVRRGNYHVVTNSDFSPRAIRTYRDSCSTWASDLWRMWPDMPSNAVLLMTQSGAVRLSSRLEAHYWR
jgi:hypothetical protein